MAIFVVLRAHFYSPTNWETFNKTDLIKKYLFSKLQLLKEVYGDVDYEY